MPASITYIGYYTVSPKRAHFVLAYDFDIRQKNLQIWHRVYLRAAAQARLQNKCMPLLGLVHCRRQSMIRLAAGRTAAVLALGADNAFLFGTQCNYAHLCSTCVIVLQANCSVTYATDASLSVHYDRWWRSCYSSWQCGHKAGILGDFSEHGKLGEFSGNSVQPQGKL